jgi:hypothetical protein
MDPRYNPNMQSHKEALYTLGAKIPSYTSKIPFFASIFEMVLSSTISLSSAKKIKT